jgi:FMN phosphatase YigB (HAD superfamily)
MTTVIFDFDGTIALGTGPVVAFAKSLSGQGAGPDVVSAALLALEEFESGKSKDRDGYGSVARVATAGGLVQTDINAAYMSSRRHLGTELSPVDLPNGLASFLERLAVVATVWLATNAPAEGVAHVLESGGLDHSFARTHFNVGKPDGLAPIITDALSSGPVLSVGDIYDYDLAPAVALGADTALVGKTSSFDQRSVTMRAANLENLYPQIEAWAATTALSSGGSAATTTVKTKEP